MRALYRRVRLVAIWRRPKLTARGDPDHDHAVAQIVARLIELPRRAVVLAEDETYLKWTYAARAVSSTFISMVCTGITPVRAVLEGCPPRCLDRNAASTVQRYHGCAKRSLRLGHT